MDQLSETIGFSEEISKIKQKYGDKYWHNPACTEELSEFWGFECDEHGVVTNYNTESLPVHKSCKAEITLTVSSKGFWKIGIYAHTPMSGRAYSPNVYDPTYYTTRESARFAAIEEIETFLSPELDLYGHSAKEAIRQTLKVLQNEKQPSLDLFGAL